MDIPKDQVYLIARNETLDILLGTVYFHLSTCQEHTIDEVLGVLGILYQEYFYNLDIKYMIITELDLLC